MNPFELQTELACQWLGLLGLAAETVANAGLLLGHQSLDLCSAPDPGPLAWLGLTASSWPRPADPFQLMQAIAPDPFAMFMPSMVWPMAQWPWGHASTFMAFVPWSFGASPWQLTGLWGATAYGGWPSAWSTMGAGFASPVLSRLYLLDQRIPNVTLSLPSIRLGADHGGQISCSSE